MDRDQILEDFKSGDCPVLIATSVAARGLDVKQLHLVVNYEVPNHLEDYVHRCGRTGRAGATGDAYTFITPEQEKFAGDIIKALKESKQNVPPRLQELWDNFSSKVNEGKASFQGSGFGGRGLDRIENDRESTKKAQKKSLGINEEEEEQQVEVDENGDLVSIAPKVARSSKADAAAKKATATLSTITIQTGNPQSAVGQPAVVPPAATAPPTIPPSGPTPMEITPPTSSPAAPVPSSSTGAAAPLKPKSIEEALRLAKNKAAALNANLAPVPSKQVISDLLATMSKTGAPASNAFFAEVEINDFPPQAKFKVTQKENIARISDFSGAAITTRGVYISPDKPPAPNQRKLYLLVEGPSQAHVEKAVAEIRLLLTEATLSVIDRKQ